MIFFHSNIITALNLNIILFMNSSKIFCGISLGKVFPSSGWQRKLSLFSSVSNSSVLSMQFRWHSLKLKLLFGILQVNVKEYSGNGTFLILTNTFLSQPIMPMLLIPSHNTLLDSYFYCNVFHLLIFFKKKKWNVAKIPISVSFTNKLINCNRA